MQLDAGICGRELPLGTTICSASPSQLIDLLGERGLSRNPA